MKHRGRKIMTAHQIVEAYFLIKSGKDQAQVSRKMGIPYSTITKIEAHLHSQRQKTNGTGSRGNWQKAIQIIDERLNTHENNIPKEDHTLTLDHRTRFKLVYENFEKELALFIEAEVESREQKLIEENKRLHKDVEQMESAFQEAKNSNWINNLFKHPRA